jgi:hypothetical protein
MEIKPPVAVGLYPIRPGRVGDDDAVPWYSDYQNVVRVARYLADQGEPAEVVADMIAWPWRFTAQFEWMLNAEGADGEPR